MKKTYNTKNFFLISLFIINFIIIVIPVNSSSSTVIVDQTYTLEMGYTYYYEWTGLSTSTYNINLEVTEGTAVDFMLLNTTNFAKFWNYYTTATGESTWFVYVFGSEKDSLSLSYSFQPTISDTYFIVMENEDFTYGGATPTGPVDVHLQIYQDELPPNDNDNNLGNFLIPIILIITIIAIIGGSIFFVFYINNKKTRDSSKIYEINDSQQMIDENIPTKVFCPNCGTELLPGHSFCANCGEKILE